MANITDTQSTQPGIANTKPTSPIDYKTAAHEAFSTISDMPPSEYIKNIGQKNVTEQEAKKFQNEARKEEADALKENAKVFGAKAVSSLGFGVPELIYKATAKPEDVAKWEEAVKKSPYSAGIGEAAGIIPSLLTGSGEVGLAGKGIAKAGEKIAEKAAPSVAKTAAEAAQNYLNFGSVIGKKAASALPETAPKALKNIIEHGVAGAAYTAPAAITKAVTGQEKPEESAIEMAIGGAAGGAIGIASPLFQKVLAKLPKRVAQNELMEGGLTKKATEQLGLKGENAVEETAELHKKIMKEAGDDLEKADQIATQKREEAAKQFFDPLKKTGYTPESFEPYIKEVVSSHALMPEQSAVIERKLLGSENKDPVVLSKRLTDLQKSFKGQDDALSAVSDLRKKFDASVLNHLDTVQEKRPDLKMGVYQDYLKNYAQASTVQDMIERKKAIVSAPLVGGSPTQEKLGTSAVAGALLGGGGTSVLGGQDTEQGHIGADAATILRNTLIGSVAGPALMRGQKAGLNLLAKGAKKATPKIEELLAKGAAGKIGGKIGEANAIGRESTPHEQAPKTQAEESSEAGKTDTPETERPWYANPKGAQSVMNVLTNKYNEAIAQGIIDNTVSLDDYINQVHDITGGFNPRMLARAFYPDEEQRKVFLQQLDDYEAVKASKQMMKDSGVSIEDIASINPIENMTNQGDKIAQKEAFINVLEQLSKKGSGEASLRVAKKIENEVNRIINNHMISPKVKTKRLEGLMHGGSTSLLQNVGII